MGYVVSSEEVKKLREETGAKMLDCRDALVQTKGDIQAAKDFLRKKGMASAVRKLDRPAAEGVVAAGVNQGRGVMVEVSCETDFVARNEQFQEVVSHVLETALKNSAITTLEDLKEATLQGGEETVGDYVLQSAGRVGENIQIKRLVVFPADPKKVSWFYIHGPVGPAMGRIGVFVSLGFSGDPQQRENVQTLAKNIAMHVAAANPLYTKCHQVPLEEQEKEKEIAKSKIKSDKVNLEAVLGKAVDKYFEAVVLERQPYVLSSGHSVEEVLKEASGAMGPVELISFTKFLLGA